MKVTEAIETLKAFYIEHGDAELVVDVRNLGVPVERGIGFSASFQHPKAILRLVR